VHLSFTVKKHAGVLKVTCSQIHFKSGIILETLLDGDVVTTDH